jgi:hypothetical protein
VIDRRTFTSAIARVARALYERIGEPHSRLRKRGNVLKAIERLFVLDALRAVSSTGRRPSERRWTTSSAAMRCRSPIAGGAQGRLKRWSAKAPRSVLRDCAQECARGHLGTPNSAACRSTDCQRRANSSPIRKPVAAIRNTIVRSRSPS